MKAATICKRCNIWTDILSYIDDIEKECVKYRIPYKYEVYYSEVLNDYKVIVTMYAARPHNNRDHS